MQMSKRLSILIFSTFELTFTWRLEMLDEMQIFLGIRRYIYKVQWNPDEQLYSSKLAHYLNISKMYDL